MYFLPSWSQILRSCDLLRWHLSCSREGWKSEELPSPEDTNRSLAVHGFGFILDKIANPLYALTCKDVSFQWTPWCEIAFDQLKVSLVTAPVLAYPCFGDGAEFTLETDAGLRAILSQKQQVGCLHPLAYASRKLQAAEKNYCITELGTLGIVWAVKYFRSYLLGLRVVVYTDHVACASLLSCRNPSLKLARWGMVRWILSSSTADADSLSRMPSVSDDPDLCCPQSESSFVCACKVISDSDVHRGSVGYGCKTPGERQCVAHEWSNEHVLTNEVIAVMKVLLMSELIQASRRARLYCVFNPFLFCSETQLMRIPLSFSQLFSRNRRIRNLHLCCCTWPRISYLTIVRMPYK